MVNFDICSEDIQMLSNESVSDEGLLLSPQVRDCYLRHLTQILKENQTTCLTKDPHDNMFTEQDISSHAAQIEHQVLMACVMLLPYQRAMITIANNIKKQTQHLKLHDQLKNMTVKYGDKETQTCNLYDLNTTSTTFHNEANTNQTVNNMAVQTEDINVPIKQSQPLLELCQSPPEVTSTRNVEICSSQHLEMDVQESLQVTPTPDKGLGPTSMSVYSPNTAGMPEVLQDTMNTKVVLSRPSLDERIYKLSKSSISKTSMATKNIIEMKHSFSLELYKIFNKMKQNKTSKVKHRFVELFGPDSDNEGMISEDILCKVRNRVACCVVKCLMPYYNRGKVQSDFVFKFLAQHLTDHLIANNNFPSKEVVQQRIDEYFKTHDVITSEADVWF